MCNFEKGFKLCTCSKTVLKQEEITWFLHRKNEELPLQHRIGKVAPIRFSDKELSTKEYILTQLQDQNCFDFDYTPQENDFLKIKITEEKPSWAAFSFRGGNWRHSSVHSWTNQLISFKKGKIK